MTTAMRYVQLMLIGSARTWLQNLPRNSFTSWDQFEDAFVKNFLSTYSRPATFVELQACKQRKNESLRSYIQRWTLMRNSVGVVSEDRAIDAGSARKSRF